MVSSVELVACFCCTWAGPRHEAVAAAPVGFPPRCPQCRDKVYPIKAEPARPPVHVPACACGEG